MSRENAELARSAIEAFHAGDLERMFAHYDPEVVYHTRADEPDVSTWYGLQEYKTGLASWLDTFEELRLDVEEIIDAGDRVIVVTQLRGRGKDSGGALCCARV